jgi:hypothetical protein
VAACNEIGGHLCSITCPATKVPYDLCITYFETLKAKCASEEEGFENLNPKDLNHGWVHFPLIVNGSGRRERMADNVLLHSTVNFFLQQAPRSRNPQLNLTS